ncbi:hypothetical protein M409DRAFT_23714 [Zasmidium cellare ATCC 36951]|uniref:Uncharacterized protein n=1 Tax=Zasmidium cellare ATCC 36951 TaxID=1080233 RepID=A0A6A6CFH5_ZASCE|nr:uncharacterized protein M409DRAFT_23714 [Zasmidium cellare ATCC 36951]KAF2165987.1 hypothetical protein M409DRAFT_23714 [Zasmidium cellare ATCC 36951]
MHLPHRAPTIVPPRKAVSSLKPIPVDRSARGANFFDLSAELRNLIYELAFEDLITSYPKPTSSNRRGRAQGPGVIMASRQIYQESILLYYSTVSLHFEVADKMISLLRKLGAKKRGLLSTDVYFDATSEAVVQSIRRIGSLKTRAVEQMAILQRRMRDSGATLQPGVLKLIIKCLWGGEMRPFVCWPDENGEWCFERLTIMGGDDLGTGPRHLVQDRH